MFNNAVIFDIKGLCQYSLHRGRDPDSRLRTNSNTKTVNTAAHGLTNFIETFLLPALELVQPWQILAAWDGGNDLRRSWYPQYKQKRAEREKDPIEEEEYESLYRTVKNLLASLGALQVQAPMTEADDLIALLCRQIPGKKVVYTVDVDLLQLDNEDTSVFLRDQLVEDEWKGVPLNLIRLNKAMVGDSSDGYGGIYGFGEAAWNGMVKMFDYDGMAELEQCVATGDYTVLLEAIEATEGSARKSLQRIYDSRAEWEMGYRLASLHPDLCFRTQQRKVVRPQWFVRVPSQERLATALQTAGCLDLMEKFEGFLPDQVLVTSDLMPAILEHFEAELDDSPLVAFDYETYDELKHEPFQQAASASTGTYVDVLSQRIAGASFTYGSNLQYTVYLPVAHRDTDNVSIEDIRTLLELVPSDKLAVQNAAFEEMVSKLELDLDLESPVDTQILHCFVEEDDRHGLKYLSKKYLNYNQQSYADTIGDREDMRDLSGEEVLQYGCDDAIVTARLAILFTYITLMEGTWEGIRDNEFPVVHPLNRAFEEGVNVDLDYLERIAEEDQEVINKGIIRMRELLAEHCSEPNEMGALNYYEDIEPFERAKLRADKKPGEEIEQKLSALRRKWIDLSQYKPLTEEAAEVKFVPTKKQLGDIATSLGLTVEFPNPSVSAITKWIVEVEEQVEQGVSPDAITFITLLAPAAKEIRHREGEHYDALSAWCVAYLQQTAPTKTTGDELNFDSPVQSAALLYAKLGLPIRVRTKFDPTSKRAKLGFEPAPSTDDKAVETALAEDCPEGDWRREVLEQLRLVKSARTRFKIYYKPYPLWKHPRDGMIHPQIKNCGTVTHRPSGSSPNFLQLTKKDGGRIRTSVGGRHNDHIIISPDFSGQELRILASESEDPVLLQAYLGEHPQDVHSITAAGIAPVALERHLPRALSQFEVGLEGLTYEAFIEALENEDDPELMGMMKGIRKNAKGVNFLINYLGGYATLSRNIGVPLEVAKAFMERAFRRYPRVKPWQQEIIRFAETHGYTETAYGTRRHLTDDIVSPDEFKRARAQRQGVNFVVQGCAARILKVVLREVHHTRLMQETGSVLIAPVYDELAASVPVSAAVEYTQRLCEIMRITPPGHAVPMVPEVALGPTWGELTEIGADTSTDRIEEAIDRILVARRAAA